MSIKPAPRDPVWEGKRRRAGIVAFLLGTAAALAFFAFFPGLPHVVDWGAVLVSVLVGAAARWAVQARISRKRTGT
ncbi:hypothetical protein ACWC9H_12350 [Streptomyces sp. NPDC001251]|uniref:hypothetical protein n=1 Tax=unclassified Streptomyces TaxID=2593676 RepID=UPI001E0F7CD6|nr:hypothetical protein [Streptomyces sp. MAG02]